LIDSVITEFGKIDILVNNAARGMRFVNESFMTEPKPFWETDANNWQMVINTNVNGTYLITKTVIPQMLKQKFGRIINISINLETMKREGFSPYGPSKAALESMSIIWAQELAGTGITLNILLPGGATLTGMIPPNFPEDKKQNLLKPDIIAPAAIYLASDEAENINGQRIIAVEWNKEHGINT
jgi:NAD(P)-dependent dehydrogenase (short-subunit alcohol dehydrogenase family)